MPGVEITTERQIRYVTEALKDLTLKHKIPILAVAASESEGLKGARVRFEDLFGGESVKYEPDVALMLNPTFGDESRRRQRGKQVIFSIEKNRMGPTGVEFIHTLHGENFAFETRELR
jgi:replicative DNA helicase